MATIPSVKVPIQVTLEVDDRTRAALIALGWTPPDDKRLLAAAYGHGRDDEAAALPIPDWVKEARS